MGKVLWLPKNIPRDRFYFEDEFGFQAYTQAQEIVDSKPLDLEFDWRLLLKILFGRFK